MAVDIKSMEQKMANIFNIILMIAAIMAVNTTNYQVVKQEQKDMTCMAI